jgi:hypothetical protein
MLNSGLKRPQDLPFKFRMAGSRGRRSRGFAGLFISVTCFGRLRKKGSLCFLRRFPQSLNANGTFPFKVMPIRFGSFWDLPVVHTSRQIAPSGQVVAADHVRGFIRHTHKSEDGTRYKAHYKLCDQTQNWLVLRCYLTSLT